MTEPEHVVEEVWWKSKKLLALVVNHVVVLTVAIFGIVKQPNATGQIITGTVAEVGTVAAAHQASQAATDRAQAYSPDWPVTRAQVAAQTQPGSEGAATSQITPPAPTPSPGHNPGMNL